ncbi:MAG TPA: hypothetical protein VLA24_08035 [Pseudomonadales bacterium]|nr:hypothetical protein [Pseudomonadales bacterium]
MQKQLIVMGMATLLLGCAGPFNAKCDNNTPAAYQECDAIDAGAYVAAALLEGADKGKSCADMTGKAKENCVAQQQAITESINKHIQKTDH